MSSRGSMAVSRWSFGKALANDQRLTAIDCSVGMIVSRMIVLVHFLAYGDHAAMRRLAYHVLELDRRMMNPESAPQLLVDLLQNRIALRRRHVGNFHVCRERMILGADTPQMQVVHVAHAGNRAHGRFTRLQPHSPCGA